MIHLSAPLPHSEEAPQKGQIYDNTFDLVLVPHGTDQNGQPREPLNLILQHLLKQKAVPAGFVPWEPSCYIHEDWLHWAPERCYRTGYYQLNMLLRYLHDIGVSDSKQLQPLVYAADYGRLRNRVMQRIIYERNYLYEHTGVSEYDQTQCIGRLFDYIVEVCGYHYSWDPAIIAKDKARKADEDASRTPLQRELLDNPKNLLVVVHGKDRQGKRRMALKRIIHYLTNKQVPPGFVRNKLFDIPQELRWWLTFIPEYVYLLDSYNLKQLLQWLNAIAGMSVEDKMAVIYATDWGYMDHFMYTRAKDAVMASWVTHRRGFLLSGFTKLPAEDIAAGGRAARKLVRDARNQNPSL